MAQKLKKNSTDLLIMANWGETDMNDEDYRREH